MIVLATLAISISACISLTAKPKDAFLRSNVSPHELLTNLSFLSAGDAKGRPVIFVHGTPGDASAWNTFLRDVPDGLHYIAVDRPGFGNSSKKVAMTSLQDQGNAIISVIKGSTQKAVLVGHSLGGPIIARMAIDHPDRVAGLVIVAGSLDPSLEKINPLQYVGEAWPIRLLLPASLRNANRELFALEDELEKLAEQLDELQVPIVIIHGTKDGLVPYSNVAFMEHHFPKGTIKEVVVLEGGNHFLPWNAKLSIDNGLSLILDHTSIEKTERPIDDQSLASKRQSGENHQEQSE